MTDARNEPAPEERYRPAPSVYARPFGVEVILLDFGRGEYFGLDEVGAEIWRHIERGARVEEIVDAMVATFDVLPEVAARDVRALVASLRASDLVVREGSASAV